MKSTILIILIAILIPNTAFAKRGGGLFGKSERIIKISEVDVKGADGEELFLAYKTTQVFFFMGAYMSDDGYVLGIKKSFGSYYPLSEEKIKSLQESGVLPAALPTYKIPISEWLWGFSLWILLTVLGGLWLIMLPKKKDRNFTSGCNHYFGKETPVDFNKALNYFEKSANKGHSGALHNLGIMYLNGQGVTKNNELSIEYFKNAANEGYVDSMFTLGKIYSGGTLTNKDNKKAMLYFQMACDKGDVEACTSLKNLQNA
ncbi:sel1 repeat family protein [Aureibaculum algae]|uniref:Sel1 repeat family protein n=1 Tax=Aureibaculum algae TaxID=2584122 RepID=A0A5B7TSH0_9FLAO|nr:tetratricopeptide repeat protein [Aureibaculum algae]QCX38351.1 sel1 repeat family protein [Aureibaculum algae]